MKGGSFNNRLITHDHDIEVLKIIPLIFFKSYIKRNLIKLKNVDLRTSRAPDFAV